MNRSRHSSDITQLGRLRDFLHRVGSSPLKKRLLFGVACFPVLAVAIFYFFPPITPDEILTKAGYLKMVPPSTFHGPGTLNTVEMFSDNSVKLHPTCEIDVNEIAGMWKVSDSIDQEVREHLSSGFSIQSKILEKSNSFFTGGKVRDVRLSMKNIKILLLTHESLLNLQKNFVKGTCEEAIIHNLREGAKVCQTEAVLQADMIYTVVFNDNVDASQQEKITQDVTSSLGAKGDRISKNELKGDKLFYGIRLSKNCLQLNQPMVAQR